MGNINYKKTLGVEFMNILIIYAHPEPKSFNGALKDLAVQNFHY